MRMNARLIFSKLLGQLTLDESREENQIYVYWLLEHFLNLKKVDVLRDPVVEVDESIFKSAIQRLNNHEPIQYVLQEAWFYGRRFTVNSHALIPRPETEILVAEVLKTISGEPVILDIGTGSGCMAITLSLEHPKSRLYATDIHSQTLALATLNAQQLGAKITFMLHDILQEPLSNLNLDYLISNPPYVLEKEKNSISDKVKLFEPSTALFVPDHDPLLFYRAIAGQGKATLKPGGRVIVEINESQGRETAALFVSEGYQEVQLIKDLQQKDRIVSGRKPTLEL